jgi:rod shape-determining protein MreB
MYIDKPLTMEIKGRDMVSGLPRIITVNSDDTTEALQHDLELLVTGIKEVLHNTPPELSADVMDKGIILSGGSDLLRNVDALIAEATGVPTYIAEEPLLCVARGTGIASKPDSKRSIWPPNNDTQKTSHICQSSICYLLTYRQIDLLLRYR